MRSPQTVGNQENPDIRLGHCDRDRHKLSTDARKNESAVSPQKLVAVSGGPRCS
jgi:hypothetical protein